MSQIDHDFLEPAMTVIGWLNGPAMRASRQVVDSYFCEAIRAGKDTVVIAGKTYSTDVQYELNACNRFGCNPRITPAGARFLLEMHEKGILPIARRKRAGDVDPALLAYIASEAELIAKSEESAARARQADAVYQALLDDPSEVGEWDFTYTLLTDIFVKRMGTYSGSITIGGIQVVKTVEYAGGTHGARGEPVVKYSWRSHDGERKVIGKHTRYSTNRKKPAEDDDFAESFALLAVRPRTPFLMQRSYG
jgi:hypothetical protein